MAPFNHRPYLSGSLQQGSSAALRRGLSSCTFPGVPCCSCPSLCHASGPAHKLGQGLLLQPAGGMPLSAGRLPDSARRFPLSGGLPHFLDLLEDVSHLEGMVGFLSFSAISPRPGAASSPGVALQRLSEGVGGCLCPAVALLHGSRLESGY